MNIVHTEASWGWGGQEIRILTESAEFIKRGHSVKLVADPRSTIARRAEDYGVPLLPVTLRAKRLPDLIALRTALKTLKPDVVVCHSSTDHWLTALARLTLCRRFTIVRARHISAKINKHFTTKWLYKGGCEGCLTTSTSIQNAMIRQGLGDTHRIRSIPTGIQAPPPLPHYLTSRHQLDISPDRFAIVIVATLRSWKGHEDLIVSLTLLGNAHPLLLVVGDGPQADPLKKLARSLGLEEQIRFLGHQSEIYNILNAADVFALPSYANEGVPQAVLQAMAIGLPIVSCPVGGIPEALEGYTQKILVPPRSPSDLGQALEKTYELYFRDAKPVERTRIPLLKFTPDGMYRDCVDLYGDSIIRFRLLHGHGNERKS